MREQDYFLIERMFSECFLDAPCSIPGPGDKGEHNMFLNQGVTG